jgi:hypothetical protein
MMEWILLVVLVPAIVVPIVLLFGFAGCDLIFELKDPQPGPANLVAVVESRSAIKLTWDVTGFESARFEVRRKRSVDAAFEVLTPAVPPFTGLEFPDTGLEEATSFDYRVVAFKLSDGEFIGTSEVTAATLGKAFETTLPIEAAGANRCVVQRIEPSRLARSGTRVQLTLAVASGGPLLINGLSISHAAASGDPYDSDGTLTILVDVNQPLFIPADPAAGIHELPAIDFPLDQTRPLLVAFDTGLQGQVRLLTNVSTSEATSFASPAGVQQAGVADRQSGFVPVGSIALVQRIDAG